MAELAGQSGVESSSPPRFEQLLHQVDRRADADVVASQAGFHTEGDAEMGGSGGPV